MGGCPLAICGIVWEGLKLQGRLGGSVAYAAAFRSGQAPRVLGWSHALGSLLSRELVPLPACCSLLHVFSLSLSNKLFFF